MKNCLPFLDPPDASEGVKTFFEGVSLFSNQTPVFLFKYHRLGKSVHYAGLVYFPTSSWRTFFFSACIFVQMYFPTTLFIIIMIYKAATATTTISV